MNKNLLRVFVFIILLVRAEFSLAPPSIKDYKDYACYIPNCKICREDLPRTRCLKCKENYNLQSFVSRNGSDLRVANTCLNNEDTLLVRLGIFSLVGLIAGFIVWVLFVKCFVNSPEQIFLRKQRMRYQVWKHQVHNEKVKKKFDLEGRYFKKKRVYLPIFADPEGISPSEKTLKPAKKPPKKPILKSGNRGKRRSNGQRMKLVKVDEFKDTNLLSKFETPKKDINESQKLSAKVLRSRTSGKKKHEFSPLSTLTDSPTNQIESVNTVNHKKGNLEDLKENRNRIKKPQLRDEESNIENTPKNKKSRGKNTAPTPIKSISSNKTNPKESKTPLSSNTKKSRTSEKLNLSLIKAKQNLERSRIRKGTKVIGRQKDNTEQSNPLSYTFQLVKSELEHSPKSPQFPKSKPTTPKKNHKKEVKVIGKPERIDESKKCADQPSTIKQKSKLELSKSHSKSEKTKTKPIAKSEPEEDIFRSFDKSKGSKNSDVQTIDKNKENHSPQRNSILKTSPLYTPKQSITTTPKRVTLREKSQLDKSRPSSRKLNRKKLTTQSSNKNMEIEMLEGISILGHVEERENPLLKYHSPNISIKIFESVNLEDIQSPNLPIIKSSTKIIFDEPLPQLNSGKNFMASSSPSQDSPKVEKMNPPSMENHEPSPIKIGKKLLPQFNVSGGTGGSNFNRRSNLMTPQRTTVEKCSPSKVPYMSPDHFNSQTEFMSRRIYANHKSMFTSQNQDKENQGQVNYSQPYPQFNRGIPNAVEENRKSVLHPIKVKLALSGVRTGTQPLKPRRGRNAVMHTPRQQSPQQINSRESSLESIPNSPVYISHSPRVEPQYRSPRSTDKFDPDLYVSMGQSTRKLNLDDYENIRTEEETAPKIVIKDSRTKHRLPRMNLNAKRKLIPKKVPLLYNESQQDGRKISFGTGGRDLAKNLNIFKE